MILEIQLPYFLGIFSLSLLICTSIACFKLRKTQYERDLFYFCGFVSFMLFLLTLGLFGIIKVTSS